MNILVNCTGFIGDILFASSVAKKLKEKYGNCHITYNIPLPQPKLLLERNPYIDDVWLIPPDTNFFPLFDLVVNIPVVDQRYPATLQMQAAAGIEDQSLEFDVWTVPEDDIFQKNKLSKYIAGLPRIAIQKDWAWRAYQCTPESLTQRIGAPHRNTKKIVDALRLVYPIIHEIGFDRDHPSTDSLTQDPEIFSLAASYIKVCDWFIGAEGGLSNLAAAVGTKCIITTDFIEQNYGKNGRVKQIDSPQMGPAVYYPQGGHVHLSPTLTDDEIINKIIEIIG